MKCLSFGKNDPDTIIASHNKFDLLELRLDLAQIQLIDLKNFSPEILAKLIITDKRLINNLLEFIKTAIGLKVFAIDLDYQTYKRHLDLVSELLIDSGVKLIFSLHNVSHLDNNTIYHLQKMKKLQTLDYIKIVFDESHILEVKYLIDVYKMFDFKNIIAFVGGDKLRWTRILSYILAPAIIYLALDEDSKTASGQFTINEFEQLQRLLNND